MTLPSQAEEPQTNYTSIKCHQCKALLGLDNSCALLDLVSRRLSCVSLQLRVLKALTEQALPQRLPLAFNLIRCSREVHRFSQNHSSGYRAVHEVPSCRQLKYGGIAINPHDPTVLEGG